MVSKGIIWWMTSKLFASKCFVRTIIVRIYVKRKKKWCLKSFFWLLFLNSMFFSQTTFKYNFLNTIRFIYTKITSIYESKIFEFIVSNMKISLFNTFNNLYNIININKSTVTTKKKTDNRFCNKTISIIIVHYDIINSI